ncbi:hypothetical protein BpHYR1_012034 [Brachionus plicatilis]|uniref:Uncharacterized protein n=1 Tax=Brachionus plicatilis TaxID=10195 RepID=A0A3M7QBQ8_BRAPC|nr:hypothetical protein BpHYR1_012034 [Brachionus plicatilis]
MKKTFNTIRFLLGTKNSINFCKKSFCAERFEIVLNGYFFVLKRIKSLTKGLKNLFIIFIENLPAFQQALNILPIFRH